MGNKNARKIVVSKPLYVSRRRISRNNIKINLNCSRG